MHDTSYLYNVLVLLSAAVVIVACFRHLHISPVIGYLVAGAAIGPSGLAIIQEVETTTSIAEIGIVFLLFMIGLELSLERLKEMRKQVFGFGSLQVALTSGIIGGIVLAMGYSVESAIIIGGGLAFSSTAIVLQVVAERGEQSSQTGRLALAVLLLQDFAVVPMLVLIPLLATTGSEGIFLAVGEIMIKAIIAMIAIVIAGRLVLRPFFRIIAATKSPELFVSTTLLIVLFFSFATEHAGLSLALGAFIAGILVAETEYQHQVEADITPFKGLFLGLFFMTVGMSVNIQTVTDRILEVLMVTFGLIVIKAAILLGLCSLFKYRMRTRFHASFLLAQGSEFAFILFGMASMQGLMADGLAELLMVSVTLSMALTPLLNTLGNTIGNRFERQSDLVLARASTDTVDIDNHIIIAGYGRMGQTLADMLTIEKKCFVAVDMDPANIALGRKQHRPVYYGDARRLDVLQSVGIDRATYMVFAFTHPTAEVRAIRAIRRIRPDITIICRAMQNSHAKLLKAAGADIVVLEALESSLLLGQTLLRAKNVPEQEIQRVLQDFRLRQQPDVS